MPFIPDPVQPIKVGAPPGFIPDVAEKKPVSPFEQVEAEGGFTGAVGKTLGAGVGLFRSISNITSKGYEAYKGAPIIKQAGRIGGAVVGTAGEVIGTGIGAVGAALTGKPILETAEKIGKETGAFGAEIGREGVAAAPLSVAGRLINIPLAVAQVTAAGETLPRALKTGDRVALVEAGVQLATGILAGHGSIRNKGLLLDESVKKILIEKNQKLQSILELGRKTPEAKANQAAGIWSDVLNIGTGEAKRLQKKELAGRGKDIPRLLAEEGVILKQTPDKKIQTTDAIKELRDKQNAADLVLSDTLKSDTASWASLKDIRNRAIEEVKSRKGMIALEKEQGIGELEKIFDAEYRARGIDPAKKDIVLTGTEANEFKRGLYGWAYDEKGLPRRGAEAMHDTARLIKEDIEKHYKERADIKGLNEKVADYIEMQNTLRSIEGRTVRGGVLGRKLNQIIGGGIGAAAAGPAGGLIGVQTAGKITDILTNIERRTRRAAGLIPKPIEKAQEIINGHDIDITKDSNYLKKLESFGAPDRI